MRGFLRKSIGRNGGTDEYGITLLWNSPFIRRIYLMNLLIVAAATGLFGIYLYVSTFAQAKEQLLENSRKTMREVTSDIEAAVRRMETQAAGMVLDESFRESVGGLERKSPAELYDSFRVLNDLCADAENMDGIYRIFLVFTEHHRMMDNGERIYYDDMGIADAAAGQSRFWIRSEGRIAGEYIYGVRADAGGGETVFLLFDLLERVRQQWVEQLTLSDSGGAFLGRIQDGEGDGPEAEAMKRIAEHGGATGDFTLQTEGGNHFVLFERVDGTPFYAVSYLPTAEIEQQAVNSVRGMFFILIPIFALVIAVSYVASVRVTRHLRRLVFQMNQIYPKEGKRADERKKDEIELLQEAFTEMQKRVDRAVREAGLAEKKQRVAEQSLMQAQINPHFLYNTLDSIHWLAVKMNVPQISFIVRNMSDYFRMGLNSGKQITTLRKEIAHTVSYFNIQKFRFDDRIQLYVDVPEEMLELPMIVLTLQPIVENAILHGILAEEGRKGKIFVSGEYQDGQALLYVEDDGIGMSEEEAERLNRRVKKGKGEESGTGGFGLYNVNARLRYYFGEEYGLDIISSPGEGTTCILSFPGKEEMKG